MPALTTLLSVSEIQTQLDDISVELDDLSEALSQTTMEQQNVSAELRCVCSKMAKFDGNYSHLV